MIFGTNHDVGAGDFQRYNMMNLILGLLGTHNLCEICWRGRAKSDNLQMSGCRLTEEYQFFHLIKIQSCRSDKLRRRTLSIKGGSRASIYA